MSAASKPISARTCYCAVYGYPIAHSASPPMQNAGLAALGLDWRYLAFEVRPSQLRQAIDGAKAMGFIGLNLTLPHKLLAVEMMDALDDSARAWGAVNTIRFEGRTSSGEWMPLGQHSGSELSDVRAQGFNTDADAIVRSLREDLGVEPKGASILLLGAGGAGRTAALKLASAGARHLYLVNRTLSKAEALGKEISLLHPHTHVEIGYPLESVDLVLNTTSLGLKTEDPLPLDEAMFAWNQTPAVYDMIYRPAMTSLLRKAKAAGCRTANGLGMLLYQGTQAQEIWTGQPAPVEIMRRALIEYVGVPVS